jgi:hypothetical protein
VDYNNVENDRHDMMLRQMGGDVITIYGMLCYVKFNIEGVDIEYVYNINAKKKYFLQRIKPYPLPAGVYEDPEDVIDIISIDIEQFRTAIHSEKFNTFVEINKNLNETIRNIDDLFLYYKVPKESLVHINENIQQIKDIISGSKDRSERLYFKKDPDTI